MAYDSYDWPPGQHGWPVSFFVVTLILVGYVLAGLPRLRRRRPHERLASGDVCDGALEQHGRREASMFSGFMVNAWTVGVDRRRRRRARRLLHRPARLGVRRARDPQRVVRRRRRRRA